MVRELANARQAVEMVAADLAALEAKIATEIPMYATTKAALKTARKDVKAKEEALRTVVANRFEFMGERPDHPALGLQNYSKLHYNPEMARAWAVKHQLCALLELNTSAFEAVAPVLYSGNLETIEWVEGTIASKLQEWAGEPEDETEPA